MSLIATFRASLQTIATSTSSGEPHRYIVALSGGLDSRVLLHLCMQEAIDFRVVHIHHGLQAGADDWSRFCANLCEKIEADYVCIHVDARPKAGESPEESARDARYQGLASQMHEGDILLTAHHQDDQAETLLLQLMRGAGPAGLAAMPACKPFGPGWLARPLLGVTRDALRNRAAAEGLEWLEDPSNTDTALDRNYIRHGVMPVLQQRWPEASARLEHTARLQQDAVELQDALARIDMQSLVDERLSLDIALLLALPRTRRLNLLRFWIRRHGIEKPRKNILNEINDSVLPAADDADPLVSWGRAEVRRYRNRLYLMRTPETHAPSQQYAWDGELPLLLEDINVEMRLEQTNGEGLHQDTVAKGLSVRFRSGGETIRPQGRGHTHSLKKLMQEAGIPPWERSRIPLLYVNGALACVCGYWIAEEYSVEPGELGWTPVCEEIGPRA